jgi:hypothetical protein
VKRKSKSNKGDKAEVRQHPHNTRKDCPEGVGAEESRKEAVFPRRRKGAGMHTIKKKKRQLFPLRRLVL